jgi:hypothetical protein
VAVATPMEASKGREVVSFMNVLGNLRSRDMRVYGENSRTEGDVVIHDGIERISARLV